MGTRKSAVRRRGVVVSQIANYAIEQLERRVLLDAVMWTGATNASWAVATNWLDTTNSTQHVPASADDVTIPTAASPTILVTGSQSINSLVSGQPISIENGGSLAVSTTASSAQNVTFNGGAVQGGTWTFTSGSFVCTTNSSNLLSGVTVNGDVSLSASSAYLRLAGSISMNGTIHVSGSSAFLGLNNAVTLAAGTISFEGTSGTRAGIEGVAGSSLTIASGATLHGGFADLGGSHSLGGTLSITNNGTISADVSGQSLALNGGGTLTSFTNNNIAQAINGGTLSITANSSWSNTGSISANASTLTFAGSWSNTGTLSITNSTLNLGGSFTTAGINLPQFTRTGGTVNLAGALNNASNTLTLNASTGSWVLNGGSITGGTVTLMDSSTLSTTTNSSNLLSGVTVNGDVSLSASSAYLRLAGSISMNGTIHVSGSSAFLGLNNAVTLAAGTISFEGTSGTRAGIEGVAGSSLTIASGATLHGGFADLGGSHSLGGTLSITNNGTISADVSGQSLALNGGGTLTSFTNNNIAQAINGGTLSITANSSWSNTGSISANASTLTFAGSWSNTGTLSITNSTLNLGGSFTTAGINLPQFTRTGGTVNLTGALNNASNTLTLNASTGSWVLNGGSITGGTVTLMDSSTLSTTTNSSNLLSGVTVNGDVSLSASSAYLRLAGSISMNGTIHVSGSSAFLGLNNAVTLAAGTISFEGTSGTRAGIEGVAGSSLTIASGATLHGGFADLGGSHSLGGTLSITNNGTISADVSGQSLALNGGGTLTSFTNNNIAQAINGGTLSITANSSWSNTGSISANASTLTFAGSWSNTGTLSITNSTLNLGGSFTTAGINLPQFTRTGGTVNLAGALNNASNTLTLNASTGSWVLNGGSITGGTLTEQDSSILSVGTNSSNLLSGVTVNGDVTLSASSAYLRLAGSISMNGTIHVSGSSAFLGLNNAVTLAAGTISFEGTSGTRAGIEGVAGSSLTIASGATLHGGFADLGGSRSLGGTLSITNNGTISADVSGQSLALNGGGTLTSFTNNNIAQATNGGTLSITANSSWSNTGSISANASTLTFAGSWSNTGTLSITNSTLNLGGSFTTAGINLPQFTRTGGTVNLAGALNNASNTLTLNASTGSWVLNGGSITGGTLTEQDSSILSVGTNSSNLLSGVTVNGDVTLSASSAYLRLAGSISMNGTIHVSGSSAFLGLNNAVTLAAGTISFEGTSGTRAGIEGVAGSSLTIASGATLHGGFADLGGSRSLGGTLSITNNGTISADVSGQSLALNGGGTLTSFTNNNIAQATNGGTLSITANSSWSNTGSISANASTLTFAGSWSNTGTLSITNSTLNLGGSFTTAGINLPQFTRTGGTVNLAGALNNASNTLTLNASTGSWVLNGGSITGGTLTEQDSSILSVGTNSSNLLSGVTVNGDVTLSASSAYLRLAGSISMNGTIHVSGSSAFLGLNNAVTLAAGTISFEGTSGTRAGIEGVAGSSLTIASGATLHGGFADLGGSRSLGGTLSITNNGTISADVSGQSLALNGGGTLTSFTNNNIAQATNGGTLSVSAGTLPNVSGTTLTGGNWLAFANSTLRVQGANIATNAAAISLDGANSNFYNATSGTTSALANLATNSATGSFSVTGGRTFTTVGALANAGAVTIGAGSTLTIGGSANYTQSAGTTTVNGGLTATSATFSGGTLMGSGNVTAAVTNNATVAPGNSPGTLTINGNYTQGSSGALSIEVGGATAGTQYDTLNVTGTATLNGALNVMLINSYDPGFAVSFPVVTAGTRSGTFSSFNGGPTASGRGLRTRYNTTSAIVGIAPTTPSAPDLTTDTGASATDNLTKVNTPTFAGSGDEGATVSILVDGVAKGSGVVSGGTYNVSISSITDGAHSITAVASDADLDSSDPSGALSITIDTVAPATLAAPDMTAASDSGSSNTDNITSVTTPTFAGTAEAGSTVRIFSDGNLVGTGVATAGNYSIQVSALSDGAHNINATATDAAGNESALGGPLSIIIVTIDTIAPAAPSTPNLDDGSDSGFSISDEITNVNTPTFTGSAEAGSTVKIFSDGNLVGTSTATGGNYSITISLLVDGLHAITATATDAAGNVSVPSNGLSVMIDTIAPAAPGAPDLQVGSDSGVSSADNITNVNTPRFDVVSTDAYFRTERDGSGFGALYRTGSTFGDSAQPDGDHIYKLQAVDAAGNASSLSSGITVTIDTIAPATPGAPDLQAGSDSGATTTDNYTNDTTPTFDVVSTDAYYRVELDSTQISGDYVTAASYTAPATGQGAHNFGLRAVDAAGNASAASTLSVTIDTAAPTITNPGDQSFEIVNTAGTTVNYTPATASDNLDPAPAVLNSPAPGSSFLPGSTTVNVTATDLAGNSSGTSFHVTLVDPAFISRGPGAAYGFTGAPGSQTLTISSGQLTFTADAGSTKPNLGVVLTGSGTALAINTSEHLASLNLGAGTTAMLGSGGGKVLRVGGLSIDPTAKLDLADNVMIVDYSGSSPLSMVQLLIQQGSASGAWTGNGITSSTAAGVAANASVFQKTALGFADASAIGNPSTFAGETLTGPAVLVRYTHYGDANLDAMVSTADFVALALKFNQSGKTWSDGEFNLDGKVNALDFNAIATDFGAALPAPPMGAVPLSMGTGPTSLFSDQPVAFSANVLTLFDDGSSDKQRRAYVDGI